MTAQASRSNQLFHLQNLEGLKQRLLAFVHFQLATSGCEIIIAYGSACANKISELTETKL